MTLRDLTKEQQEQLMKMCAETFERRNKSQPVSDPFDWDEFKVAYSDGVRDAMKVLLP